MENNPNAIKATKPDYRRPVIKLPLDWIAWLVALFVVLKAFGKLNWSWWAVFSPFWGPVAFVLGVIVLVLAVLVILWIIVVSYEWTRDRIWLYRWRKAREREIEAETKRQEEFQKGL